MIDPMSAAAGTAGIVISANALSNKPLVTIRFVVGACVYLIGLAALNGARPQLASTFAVLVLVAAIFQSGQKITKGLKL